VPSEPVREPAYEIGLLVLIHLPASYVYKKRALLERIAFRKFFKQFEINPELLRPDHGLAVSLLAKHPVQDKVSFGLECRSACPGKEANAAAIRRILAIRLVNGGSGRRFVYDLVARHWPSSACTPNQSREDPAARRPRIF
jgi:hypothetical protein